MILRTVLFQRIRRRQTTQLANRIPGQFAQISLDDAGAVRITHPGRIGWAARRYTRHFERFALDTNLGTFFAEGHNQDSCLAGYLSIGPTGFVFQQFKLVLVDDGHQRAAHTFREFFAAQANDLLAWIVHIRQAQLLTLAHIVHHRARIVGRDNNQINRITVRVLLER